MHIARTDNKTDMRYMINMDYSADLPINTMGRRIRTRLYFTSESHLHTLINVLRFAFNGNSCSGNDCSSPVLSPYGMNLLNESKEVCYLTQIVIRLFEDTSRKLNDARRFRVEILFSAGATATPIHQARSTKETDLTRLDTEPLQAVGRDGLTCAEVEDFFGSIITERGKSDGHHDVEAIPDPGVPTPKATAKPVTKKNNSEIANSSKTSKSPRSANENTDGKCLAQFDSVSGQVHAGEESGTLSDPDTTVKTANTITNQKENVSNPNATKNLDNEPNDTMIQTTPADDSEEQSDSNNKNKRDEEGTSARFRKYFYLSLATGTLVLGAGCLVVAMGLGNKRRHYSRR